MVAGPSFAYRTSCSVRVDFGGFGGSQDCEDASGSPEDNPFGEPPAEGSAENLDFFKKTDVGGVIGGGITTTAGGRDVFVQLRYSRSLLSIARDDSDGTSPRNTGISLTFGFGF